MSSSKLKLVRTRRSTVLSLPLSLGFLDFYSLKPQLLKGGFYFFTGPNVIKLFAQLMNVGYKLVFLPGKLSLKFANKASSLPQSETPEMYFAQIGSNIRLGWKGSQHLNLFKAFVNYGHKKFYKIGHCSNASIFEMRGR